MVFLITHLHKMSSDYSLSSLLSLIHVVSICLFLLNFIIIGDVVKRHVNVRLLSQRWVLTVEFEVRVIPLVAPFLPLLAGRARSRVSGVSRGVLSIHIFSSLLN